MAKPSCQGTPPLAMPCSLRSGVFSGSPRGCMSPSPSRLLKEMDLSTWQERGYDLGGRRAGLYEQQLSLFSALLCCPTTSVRTGPHQWSRDHQCQVHRKRKTTIWSGWDPTGDPLVLSFKGENSGLGKGLAFIVQVYTVRWRQKCACGFYYCAVSVDARNESQTLAELRSRSPGLWLCKTLEHTTHISVYPWNFRRCALNPIHGSSIGSQSATYRESQEHYRSKSPVRRPANFDSMGTYGIDINGKNK